MRTNVRNDQRKFVMKFELINVSFIFIIKMSPDDNIVSDNFD